MAAAANLNGSVACVLDSVGDVEVVVPWSDLQVRALTSEEAERVASWGYDGDWSIYDLPSAQPLIDDLANYFAVLAGQRLVGFCCVGSAARVSGLPEDAAILDVGIGMDPELVGAGHGAEFGQMVLRYLVERYPRRSLRAVVQSWNERSLRLTQRLGFNDAGELLTVQGGRAVAYRIVIRSQSPDKT